MALVDQQPGTPGRLSSGLPRPGGHASNAPVGLGALTTPGAEPGATVVPIPASVLRQANRRAMHLLPSLQRQFGGVPLPLRSNHYDAVATLVAKLDTENSPVKAAASTFLNDLVDADDAQVTAEREAAAAANMAAGSASSPSQRSRIPTPPRVMSPVERIASPVGGRNPTTPRPGSPRRSLDRQLRAESPSGLQMPRLTTPTFGTAPSPSITARYPRPSPLGSHGRSGSGGGSQLPQLKPVPLTKRRLSTEPPSQPLQEMQPNAPLTPRTPAPRRKVGAHHAAYARLIEEQEKQAQRSSYTPPVSRLQRPASVAYGSPFGSQIPTRPVSHLDTSPSQIPTRPASVFIAPRNGSPRSLFEPNSSTSSTNSNSSNGSSGSSIHSIGSGRRSGSGLAAIGESGADEPVTPGTSPDKTERRLSLSGSVKSERRLSNNTIGERRLSGIPTPERRLSGSGTPERRLSGTPSERRLSGVPTPERRLSGIPTPERRLSGIPTPERRLSGSATPERRSGTPSERRISGAAAMERRSSLGATSHIEGAAERDSDHLQRPGTPGSANPGTPTNTSHTGNTRATGNTGNTSNPNTERQNERWAHWPTPESHLTTPERVTPPVRAKMIELGAILSHFEVVRARMETYRDELEVVRSQLAPAIEALSANSGYSSGHGSGGSASGGSGSGGSGGSGGFGGSGGGGSGGYGYGHATTPSGSSGHFGYGGGHASTPSGSSGHFGYSGGHGGGAGSYGGGGFGYAGHTSQPSYSSSVYSRRTSAEYDTPTRPGSVTAGVGVGGGRERTWI